MCEIPCDYNPLACPGPLPPKKRPFTVLLLHCWQTEYDKRPYENFQFRILDFQERMGRNYHMIKDLRVVVKYLHQRKMVSASFLGITVSNRDSWLLHQFVNELMRIRRIELKLMQLPREFFVMLRISAARMRVTELSLEGTPLTDDDVTMLREFLIINPTLRKLNVASCSITQFNFAIIADGVHKSAKVSSFNCSRILGLSLSLDTTKIAHTLASIVWQNRLVELTMQQCEFTAQDMEVLSEYLYRKDCKMRKLSYAYNIIGPDGVRYLMRAIAKSSTLESLDISNNSIGTHGGEWVAQYLSSCKMLQYIYLNNNAIGDEAINLILTSMKKPVKLKKLYFYGNMFNSQTAKIIRRLIEAKVLQQDVIDVTYTFDETVYDWRVLPWR